MTFERQLVVKLVAGDEFAFAALYDMHARSVHRYAWALVHDRDSAADVVQETFLAAWRRRRDIRLATDSLLPWLLATARYISMNELRRLKRHPTEAITTDQAVPGPSTDDVVEQRIQLEAVVRSLERMDDLDQKIVRLCLFEGLTYEQAARALHITTSSVGKRLERARKRLRTARPFYPPAIPFKDNE